MSSYIRKFGEISADDVGVVGGKGANLGEMTRAGLPVPPGFCVTAEAYRAFIKASGAGQTIRKILAGVTEDQKDIEVRTEQVRNFLIAQEIPPRIAGEIRDSYRQLSLEAATPDPMPAVAVRSSATAEDLPTASFAGQQDTYLNIRGDGDLLDHVKQCWASLWTARAFSYRAQQGFDHDQVALAVVVQEMVRSDVSGILFTANPVTGSRDEVVINASWGLGEAIVSGLVTPDTYTVRKRDRAVLGSELGDKARLIEYPDTGDGAGTVEREVPEARRHIPAMSDPQIIELVRIGEKIESHYGAPMDVEWALAGDKFYILQARPITTLEPNSRSPMPRGEYNRSMFVEIFPDSLSPSFLSAICPILQSMLDFTFKALGFEPPRDMDAIAVFQNQPYFRREYIERAFQPLSPRVRDALVAQVVNLFGRHQRVLPTELSIPFLRMIFRLWLFIIRFPSQLPAILKRYQSEIRAAESLELERMSDQEIMDRVRELVFGSAERFVNYDFLIITVIGITYQVLGTLLGRYFGAESDEIRSELISGVTGNVTMETNKRIWDLAQEAKTSPAVSAALRRFYGWELRTELERTSEGQAFLAELNGFLAKYGHREARMDILYPTWSEDPAPVLAFIRAYLEVGESVSPHRQQERLASRRQGVIGQVRTRMSRDLWGRVVATPLFDWVLKHAQEQTRERDTMHFELTRLFPPFRRMLFELGHRWTRRGDLDTPDDILYLTLDEMIRLADKSRPMQDKVARSKSDFEASKLVKPPSIIRDGLPVTDEEQSSGLTPGQLRGVAGSPGLARGVARVILGPEEFHRLHSGEILVAPLTNPVWTPLFAIAGGLVTEVGGILSHGAIVAREYGIPAVMAVRGATKTLQDGQRLTVDGNKGIVSIDPVEAP